MTAVRMIKQSAADTRGFNKEILSCLPSEFSNLFISGDIKIAFNVRCFVDFVSDMLRGFITILIHHKLTNKQLLQEECVWCVNIAFNKFLENKIEFGWQHTFERTHKNFPVELFYKNPRTLHQILNTHLNGLTWNTDFQFSYSSQVTNVFTIKEANNIFMNICPVENIQKIQSLLEAVHAKFVKDFELLDITGNLFIIRNPNLQTKVETKIKKELVETNRIFESIQKSKAFSKNKNKHKNWSTIGAVNYPQTYETYYRQRKVSFEDKN